MNTEDLKALEDCCMELPACERQWEDRAELKDVVRNLLITGCADVEGGTLWIRSIEDGLDYVGWLCRVEKTTPQGIYIEGYGKGVCIADSVLAAILSAEVAANLQEL